MTSCSHADISYNVFVTFNFISRRLIFDLSVADARDCMPGAARPLVSQVKGYKTAYST